MPNLMTSVPGWVRSALGLQELQLPNQLVSPDVQGVVELFGEGWFSERTRIEWQQFTVATGTAQILLPRANDATEQSVLIACDVANVGAVNGRATFWLCPPGVPATGAGSINIATVDTTAGVRYPHTTIWGGIASMPWIPNADLFSIEVFAQAADHQVGYLRAFVPKGRYPR